MSLKKEILGEGQYLRLCQEGRWEWCERVNCTGVVVILAKNSKDEVLLVEQYRMALKQNVIELPAGLVGDQHRGETLELAAERELFEETGYRAGAWEILAEGPPSAGLTPERITLFRASQLEKVGPGGGDEHEQLKVHEVPLAELPAWLDAQRRAGKAVDPKIYAGLYFL